MTSLAAISKRERILGGLWGSLVGDALGVPVEFKDRKEVQADPVKDMRGFGSHKQPPGTWSDDGSLTLCTVDSLLNRDFDLEEMGRRFVEWLNHGLWTAWGEPFDVGVATSDALLRIANGTPAAQAGSQDEYSNGNGSLMRILPVVMRFAGEPLELFSNYVSKASAITHGHARSQMACVFYGLVIRQLMFGWKPQPALDSVRVEFSDWYGRTVELTHFRHVLEDDFISIPESEIDSSGYVLQTLSASLWCLLTTSTFTECVLKAVNLGGDTDTTGCIAGGLAGVHYGISAIPDKWIHSLARHDEVESLFNRFAATTLSPK